MPGRSRNSGTNAGPTVPWNCWKPAVTSRYWAHLGCLRRHRRHAGCHSEALAPHFLRIFSLLRLPPRRILRFGDLHRRRHGLWGLPQRNLGGGTAQIIPGGIGLSSSELGHISFLYHSNGSNHQSRVFLRGMTVPSGDASDRSMKLPTDSPSVSHVSGKG